MDNVVLMSREVAQVGEGVRGVMGVSVSSILNKFSRVALVCGLAFAASSFLWAEESTGKVGEVARPSTGVISAPSEPDPQKDGPQKSASTMVASYYGYSLEGSPTATGEPFEPEGYTAAHKSLPLGTELEVSYGGESVRVVVNDRGPYVARRDIDLSLAAAREIGLVDPGTAPVRVRQI